MATIHARHFCKVDMCLSGVNKCQDTNSHGSRQRTNFLRSYSWACEDVFDLKREVLSVMMSVNVSAVHTAKACMLMMKELINDGQI